MSVHLNQILHRTDFMFPRAACLLHGNFLSLQHQPIVFCLGLTAIFHLISSDPMVVMGQSIFPSRGLKSSPCVSNYMKSVKTVCFSIRFFFSSFFKSDMEVRFRFECGRET
jgi:hypothetical protein